jgi:hypothetical protein
MKFLKQKNISKFSISDNTLLANDFGRVVMDVRGGLLLPKGTTDQRPKTTSVRQPTNANGMIRYNTTQVLRNGVYYDIGLEAFVGGNWEVVRAPGAASVDKKELTPTGDAVEYNFTLPSDYQTLPPRSADNILVLVENVLQISSTNFELVQLNGSETGTGYPNAPYAAGWYLHFTSPVPYGKKVTVYFGFAN